MTARLFRIVASVASVILLSSCTLEREEAERIVSPNSDTVATVEYAAGGGAAGVSFIAVSIKRTSGDARWDAEVVVANYCNTLVPSWRDNSTLIVQYDSSCNIYGFKNYWFARPPGSDQLPLARAVEVILDRVGNDVRY